MGDVTTFESSFESNGNGRARPMEVIPAGRERRQWTPEAKAQGNGAEIRINIKGMTIRIPDGVTADHIERVLLAVQVST